MIRAAASAGLLALALTASPPAHAESGYPSRPIRIVAAQQAGSATDNVARLLADALADALAQSTVVDNRPGASGAIGTQAVARAAPDGYTLLIGGLSNMVTSPLLEPGYGVDAEAGFIAIGRVAFVPFVLAVHPDVPAKTLGELVAQARAHPGAVSFATSGPTSYSRLCMDQLMHAQKVDLLAVEYRGAPAATIDLVAGRVQVYVNEVATMKQHADAGRLRILAVAGDRRSHELPGVPTFGETGQVEIPLTPWYGLFAPAGVPPDVVAKLEAGYRAAMRDPKVLARLASLGYEPVNDEPGRFAAALRRDIAEARTMAQRTGRLTAK